MAKRVSRTAGKKGSASSKGKSAASWDDLMKGSKDMVDQAKEQAAQGFNRGPADIEDGKYIVRVTSGRADSYENKNGKDKKTNPIVPYVSFNMVVAAGEHTGTQLSMFFRTDNVTGLSFVWKALAALGFPTDDMSLSQIPEALAEVTTDKPYMMVTVKNKYTKKDGKTVHNQNVYFNEEVDPEQHDIDLAENETTAGDAEEATETTKPRRGAKKAPATTKGRKTAKRTSR